eukprot:1253967-Rhodomonas_salina.1
MGTAGSKSGPPQPVDKRGCRGLLEDIETVNKLAPCFRKDNCQLSFTLLVPSGQLNDENFKTASVVGVKRVNIDGSDAIPGGG